MMGAGAAAHLPPASSEMTDDAEFEYIPNSPEAGKPKQSPVPPWMTKGQPNETKKGVELPDGITSIPHWGKTICTLPKVAPKRATYEALVREAENNSETKSYLIWVMNNNMKSAKLDDLKGYLMASKYRPAGDGAINYLGTNSIREFGS